MGLTVPTSGLLASRAARRATGRVDRALDRILGLPGVSSRPGATEFQLRGAEVALGCQLPPALRQLLLRTNGLTIQDGLHRVMGVGPDAELDLVAFNVRDSWRWAHPHVDLDDVVVYGIDVGTWVTGFERTTGGDVGGDLLNPETIEPREWGLARRLDRGWTRLARSNRMRPDQRELLERFGRIPADHGVVHGPTWHQRNHVMANEATLHPLPEALVRAGDLWSSALELRQDHELVEPEPWMDDHGRTRHRWATVSAQPVEAV